VHFKSSRNRAPRQYTEGEEGEHGYFLLELRTIADGGLVGYPNAGKSTLLRKLSAARPKVAAYPFTTLHPVVGVMELPGYRHATIADIPGLIEGAHRGIGLGHEFLRHITRCPLLIFVIDVAGSEGRSPVEDLQNLRKEIDLYDLGAFIAAMVGRRKQNGLPNANENLEIAAREISQDQHHSDLGREWGGDRYVEGGVGRENDCRPGYRLPQLTVDKPRISSETGRVLWAGGS